MVSKLKVLIPCQASLQPQEVQEVFKRKQFTMSAVCLGESILWYCMVSYYLRQRGKTGKQRLDLLLYQACLGQLHQEKIILISSKIQTLVSFSDPSETEWYIPFYQVFPDIQVLLYAFAVFIIGSNVFLYRFLNKQSQNSLGSITFTVIHHLFNVVSHHLVQAGIRNKRRNFVPAKIGIISTMIATVYILTYNIIISFEV